MSAEYDKYLESHIANVRKGYEWIKKNIPIEEEVLNKAEWLIDNHDRSKYWQYWILIHDDPAEADTPIDIPREYIIEMICDWWSFSWNSGDLYEIFDWYEKHKDYILLSDDTSRCVRYLLESIREKLEGKNETT